MREAERVILLRTVDSKWMDHIDIMDDLRDSIGMRGYAQHDPVVEYRKEGFAMFEAMTTAIREDAVRLMMRARFNTENVMRRQSVARNMSEGHGATGYTGESQAAPPLAPATKSKQPAGPGKTETNRAAQDVPKTPAHRDIAKVGRNDPCPCGSGKKYKNCHGREEAN